MRSHSPYSKQRNGCVPMRSRALPTGADMATEVGSYTNSSSTLAQLYGKIDGISENSRSSGPPKMKLP